ncbi:sulfite oxidase, putative [Phytophthora infestans T30-4]|uniref:Sulfite oxidase, putative n=1 Tax=Phytophthora infestans (strain T30-4) TaxID=403677 RepID=D0NKC4_PHYIT|nr:sulfite oxidase, putative [Phytophthora infestans T30-4]EEY60060.1 sulfite oxidase, putative [Phytophthora infestans T30-4]|eukprot:XP_002900267.1 sulfite oxidase, putative [Phytophthora infestans T30-4]
MQQFESNHPGGASILQATGKSVELFWQRSEPHTRKGVSETLKGLRIGNLSHEDFDRIQNAKENNSAALRKLFFIEETPEGDVSLSLADLKTRFKQHKLTSTIRCATPRAAGATSEKTATLAPAEWAGVLLADVRFEALDTDKQGRAFGASIPVTTALDREVGVLLAYEMDGACIPKEHGFPLRVVVPGATGARNVKFVHRIVLM